MDPMPSQSMIGGAIRPTALKAQLRNQPHFVAGLKIQGKHQRRTSDQINSVRKHLAEKKFVLKAIDENTKKKVKF